MRRVFFMLTVAALTAAMVLVMAVPALALTKDSPAFTSPDRIGGGSPTCDYTRCQGGSSGIFPSTCNETGECYSNPYGNGFRLTTDPITGDYTHSGGYGGLTPTGEYAENGQPYLAGGGSGFNCNTGIDGCLGTGYTGGPAPLPT